MSEFQYYDFRAIDRPLDDAARAQLRALSSRATITAHGFVNTYEWGSFKGDPNRLMERWFDLFVYWANWGTRTLMLRLPQGLLAAAQVESYFVDDVLVMRTTGRDIIVTFARDGEDFSGEEPGDGVADALAGLRAELMRGDRRCLYLGWLLGVQDGQVADDDVEPPPPPGLGSLSAPLAAFVAFFGLDPDLVKAAAAGQPDATADEPPPGALEAVIAGLSAAEKTALLCRAAIDGDPNIGHAIHRRWRETLRQAPAAGTRAAGALLAAANAIGEDRERRRTAREAAERNRRLDALAQRGEAVWDEIEQLIGERLPKSYDKAASLLAELEALARREQRLDDYGRRLRALCERHRRKGQFIVRIEGAGLGAA